LYLQITAANFGVTPPNVGHELKSNGFTEKRSEPKLSLIVPLRPSHRSHKNAKKAKKTKPEAEVTEAETTPVEVAPVAPRGSKTAAVKAALKVHSHQRPQEIAELLQADGWD